MSSENSEPVIPWNPFAAVMAGVFGLAFVGVGASFLLPTGDLGIMIPGMTFVLFGSAILATMLYLVAAWAGE